MKSSSIRPAIFILLTLALSAPTLSTVLAGGDSAMTAGVHLGAAILASWCAVGVIGYLVDNYRASVARREHGARSQRPQSPTS